MVSSLPPLLKMSYTLSTTFVMTRRSTVGTETVWAPATPADRRRSPPSANTLLATTPSLRTCRRLIEFLLGCGEPTTLPFRPRSASRRSPDGRRAVARSGASLAFQLDVLVRRRQWICGDEPDPRLLHSRADAVHLGELPDGREDHLLMDQLLDAVE